LEAARPILLNGIDDFAVRSDLIDRSMWVTLPRIVGKDRCTEEVINQKYQQLAPGILGCLLDAVSCGLKNHSKNSLSDLPRMADFAMWIHRAEDALPWEAGDFLRIYGDNRALADEVALSSIPLIPALTRLAKKSITWEGTATDLLDRINLLATSIERRNNSWPTTAWMLANQLRRLAPPLERAGVGIRHKKVRGVKVIVVVNLQEDWPEPSPGLNATVSRPAEKPSRNPASISAESPSPLASLGERIEP